MVSELFWNSIRIIFGQLENINAVHWRLDQPKFRNISSQNANPTLEADLSQRSQEPIKKFRPINVEKFEMRKKSAKNVVPENSQCPHRALKTYAILSLKSAPKTSQNGEKSECTVLITSKKSQMTKIFRGSPPWRPRIGEGEFLEITRRTP